MKDALRDTISLVDKMAGKKVIHRNAAARYKSRLAARDEAHGRVSVTARVF
jgi:ribosomal protein S20